MPKPILIMPRAKQWMGTKVGKSTKTRQSPLYGKFKQGFAPGLALHFPAAGVLASYGSWASKSLEQRVDRKVLDVIHYVRETKHWNKAKTSYYYNCYVYCDVLGRRHQDLYLDDCGVHGNSLNRISIGMEVSGPGTAFRDKEGEIHASYKYKTWSSKVAATMSMPGHVSIPITQVNIVKKQVQETKPGIYVKFYPAQVRGIYEQIFDMLWCDQGNKIFTTDKIYGHSEVTTKTDPGGALYLTISEIRKVATKMSQGLFLKEFNDSKVFDQVYTEYVLKDPRYKEFYDGFIDIHQQVPTWL